MKRHLIYLVILQLAGFTAALGSGQSGENENRRGADQIGQRRYNTRRHYDRSINVIDDSPEKKLNIPERDEGGRRGLALQGLEESPAPDIGRRPGAPSPRPGPRRDEIERPEVGRNWLVDAVLNPDGEKEESDDSLRQEEEEELDSGWGWLADSLNLFEANAEGTAELNEDAVAELTDEQREILLELLGLSDEQSDTARRESSETPHAEENDIFVDHRIDGRDREIFRDHLQEATALQDRDRDEDTRAFDVRDDMEGRLAQVFGNERREDSDSSFQLEIFNQEQRRDEATERGPAFQSDGGNASAFRSAFDHNMEHRLRSPLNERRSSFGDEWNDRDDFGRASFGTPIQPIFGLGQQPGSGSQLRDTDFDRGFNANRRSERSPPSSIEQWR